MGRHTAFVRVTHWLTTLAFFALLVSGIEIVISHPRFYWGETGNIYTTPLFQLPIPASRAAVQTGFGYVLPDQNGWSRYLHFQSAWIAVLVGMLYGLYGFATRHFRRNLVPAAGDSWSAREATRSYNVMQKIAYLLVIFVLFPLVIWTGLAMSPAIVSAYPFLVTAFGGQQSARTIHFFVSVLLVLFLLVHVAMVCISGFRERMRGMISG